MIFKGKIEDKTLEIINTKLKERYGSSEDKQNYKLTWVDKDLREIRLCSHSPEGFQYVQPRYEERRKYSYINERYVLEKLCVVPAQNGAELIEVLSYEPLHCFQTSKYEPLYPKWQAITYLIDNLIEAGRVGKYYKKPIEDEDIKPEAKAKRVKALMNELFGNETEVTDALAYHEAIVVPSNFEKSGDK